MLVQECVNIKFLWLLENILDVSKEFLKGKSLNLEFIMKTF